MPGANDDGSNLCHAALSCCNANVTRPDHRNTSGGTIVVALLLLCGTFYAGLYEFAPQRWYAMQNDVPSERVYIQRKPHDCEWMSAPLGDKHCHYEKSVRKL